MLPLFYSSNFETPAHTHPGNHPRRAGKSSTRLQRGVQVVMTFTGADHQGTTSERSLRDELRRGAEPVLERAV